MWNGYIPAHQINSTDAQGRPNGVMGVPADYKPAAAPLWPFPADYGSRNASNYPNYGNYGTNYVFLPVTNQSTPYRLNLNGNTSGSPLHPWINQAMRTTNLWNVDAALVKNFAFRSVSTSGSRRISSTYSTRRATGSPRAATASCNRGRVTMPRA
jgi:hypothetical protein